MSYAYQCVCTYARATLTHVLGFLIYDVGKTYIYCCYYIISIVISPFLIHYKFKEKGNENKSFTNMPIAFQDNTFLQAHSYSLQSSSKYGSDNELTYVSATERSTASD